MEWSIMGMIIVLAWFGGFCFGLAYGYRTGWKERETWRE